MTARERFVKTLTFGDPPDRFFYDFGHPRKSTIQAWRLQGLPRFPNSGEYACPPGFNDWVGMDKTLSLPVRSDIFPAFEEKTLRETDGHRVWRDAHGIVMEDAGQNLTTPGFKTRRYIEHPVKNREDWVRMRDEHFDPHHPGRYPADWTEQAKKLKDHDLPLCAGCAGLYWKARDWVGFENLSMMFYDNPSLVHEMMEYRAWFIMELFNRAFSDVQVDFICISEDMCYKHAMMISPATFREFMMPSYKKLAEFFRSKRVPILSVDSDGHNGQLIPLLIEAGFNCVNPMEIAAHNDPVAYRKQYGTAMAFYGGIDKRELTTKEKVYAEVMGKVPWLVQTGGYRPGVDHGVPPTVHLRGYLYMCELLKAIAEKRRVPQPHETLEIERQLGPIQKMWSIDLGIMDEEEPE